MKVKFPRILLSLLLLISVGVRADELNCIRYISGGYFDLTPLSRNSDITAENVDPDNPDVVLEYNICAYAHTPCRSKSTFANLFSTSSPLDCIQLTNTTRYEGIEYSPIDPDRIGAGIQMLYTGGDAISQTLGSGETAWSPVDEATRTSQGSTKHFQFALKFICNAELTGDPTLTGPTYDSATFTYTVTVESSHACPMLTLDQVSQFIDDNKIVFTIVGTILGLLLAFLGLKLFLPTLFLGGFVSGFFICLFTFFGTIITPTSRESTKWILVAFAIVLGSALGYIAIKASRFGMFILGAWLGTIISLILYNAVLYKIHTDPAEIVLLVTVGVLALVGGLLSLKFYKHVVIVSTSLGGSYAFVRSLSLVIGGFPNEIQLINSIQLQDYNFSVEWPFYVYMNAIFLMTLFSIWVQIKLKRRAEANELEFDAEYFKKVDI